MDETIYKRSTTGKGIRKKGDKNSLRLNIGNKSFQVHQKVFIGRNAENDIPLSDPLASRIHASVEIMNGIYYLRDMDSTNGTYINGNPLKKGETRKLQRGDVIKIGNTELNLTN
ncbi:MAG: FHA domain-containing protein [Spirochaetia bacterium]